MTWKEWLHTASCLTVLHRAAAKVFAKARQYHLSPFGESNPIRKGLRAASEDERSPLEELAHDLWLFVSGHAERWEEEHPFHTLWAQGTDRIALHIAFAYSKTLLDRARTQEGDPFKAFYRRVRQLIAKNPRFQYRADPHRTFYACSEAAPPNAQLREIPPPPSYADWPSPPGSVKVSASLNASEIHDLALFFCREYIHRAGTAVWVPVRELVRYLSHWGAVHERPRFVPLEMSPSDETEESFEIPIPAPALQETALQCARVTELAQSLAASWSPQDRKAFALFYGDEETLDRVARVLGYSGASGARYRLQRLIEEFKDFCLLWPELSPPDLDENVFKAFFTALIAVCKQEDEGRNER